MSISKLDLLSVPVPAKATRSTVSSTPFYSLIKADTQPAAGAAIREAHTSTGANASGAHADAPTSATTRGATSEYRLMDYTSSRRLAAQVDTNSTAAIVEAKIATASPTPAGATAASGATTPASATKAASAAAAETAAPSAPPPASPGPVVATDEWAVWTALATGNSAGIPASVINTYGVSGLLYDPAKIMEAYRASASGQQQIASIAWIGKG
jgi:hypothetical protein